MNPYPNHSSQLLMVGEPAGVFRHHVSWTPPYDNSWRLNFAGSVSDQVPETGGAAFIIRDEDAVYKHGFATPVSDVQDVILPEFVALSNGLRVAVNLGIDYLEIEGDGNAVVHLLNDQMPEGPPILQELHDGCMDLLRSFRSVRVNHVHCFNNQAANKLAMIVSPEENPYFWPTAPPCAITGILLEDVIGRWVQVPDA